jgi:hypothetical protein
MIEPSPAVRGSVEPEYGLPARRRNGPSPTMSVSGSNEPGARNSTVVPTASPAASPSKAPR